MFAAKRILCPTDFSEPSLEGIKAGNDLALRFSGEVLLIHVIPPVHSITPAFMSPGRMLGDYYEEMVRVAKDALTQTAELHLSKEVPVQTHVLRGNPPEEIIRIADEKNVDIIVLATQGLSGTHRHRFGSVAERILRLSSVPVMTVPVTRMRSTHH